MKNLFSIIIAIFLSCQFTFASAFEVFNIASNEVHQVFSHNQVINHHHRDAFETHLDHFAAETSHQHVSDSFQSTALTSDLILFSTETVAIHLIAYRPKELTTVFLDGLLRPPRA